MNDAHQSYFKELHDPKELDEPHQWLDTRDHEYFQCRIKITEALQCLEKQDSDKMFLVSSKLSKHSSTLVRSRRNKAAARTACLQVEMDYLEREADYKKLLM